MAQTILVAFSACAVLALAGPARAQDRPAQPFPASDGGLALCDVRRRCDGHRRDGPLADDVAAVHPGEGKCNRRRNPVHDLPTTSGSTATPSWSSTCRPGGGSPPSSSLAVGSSVMSTWPILGPGRAAVALRPQLRGQRRRRRPGRAVRPCRRPPRGALRRRLAPEGAGTACASCMRPPSPSASAERRTCAPAQERDAGCDVRRPSRFSLAMRRRAGEDAVHMAVRLPAPGVRVTRRRFLAVASVATGMTGAKAAETPVAAQKADLATRFEEASRLIRAQTDSGDVAAAVLHVRRAGQELSRAFGAAKADMPFLIASLAKPMTASAVLWLRDRRELALTDPVTKFLPDFRGGERGAVTIQPPAHAHVGPARHAAGEHRASPSARALVRVRGSNLPHTVALPARRQGQLPEHGHPAGGGDRREGRRRAAAGVHGADDFRSARHAADVVRPRRSPDRRDRAVPGAGGRTERLGLEQRLLAESRLAVGRRPRDRARSRDVPRCLRLHARRRAGDGHAREMRAIQTGTLRPSFGLGWQREPGAFGRTCSAETFGHFGSTGTVFWHDPATATTCVLLTTRPAAGSRSSLLLPVSEIIGRTNG